MSSVLYYLLQNISNIKKKINICGFFPYFFIEGMTKLLVNLNEVKNLACEKSRYIGIRSTTFRSE